MRTLPFKSIDMPGKREGNVRRSAYLRLLGG